MASNLRVDSIVPATGGSVSIGTATGDVTIPGNLGIAGVLTYEDVTNIDSVGVITARDGLRVTGVTTITGTGEYLLQLNKSDSSAVYTQFTNSTSGTSTSDGFRIGMDSNEDGLVWLREDGNVKFGTDNSERLRIGGNGEIGIGGANYGTSGQVLTSQGSGSAVQWASASNPTLAHAFVFMDSQYFTSSTTLLEFNNSTTNDKSSGVTITRGGSERFTPTVAGVYLVQGMLHYTHGSGGTYTPTLYLYRNGSSYAYTQGIVNYSGGHYDSLNIQAMMTFNGSSDYVDMRANHNAGGNATMQTQSTFSMFRVGA
jgi:hypothetical protein